MILLASTGSPALPGSELQARFGTVSGIPPALDLAAEAALVRYVTEVAPRCSLAHDVSDGGLAVALAEAALHSGVGARLDLPLDAVTLFGEGCGQVILALPAEPGRGRPARLRRRRPADRRGRRRRDPRRPAGRPPPRLGE